MCSTARDDEHGEADKHPVELQIAPLPDEIQQRERNREVRQGDERVRQDVQGQDPRLPEVAHPMGHETVRGEQAEDPIGHPAPP